MSDTITFQVRGIPQPKGSTKAFMRPGMKYPVVTNDNLKTKPWAEGVRLVAQQHAPSLPWDGAVELSVYFFLVRPKSLPKKALHHIKKPDLDKLLRAVKDALKGVIYLDDSQVMEVQAKKTYATNTMAPGVMVVARRANDSI